MRSSPLGIDDVRIRRVDALGGMELVNARFLTRRSAPHCHRELEIGVVTAGNRQVHCRGRVFHATQGSILVFAPGEVHSGTPDGSQGSEYRAFLIPEDRLGQWLSVPDESTVFHSPVISDRLLASRLLRSHHALSRPGGETDRSQDGALLATVDALRRLHRRPPDERSRTSRRVGVVREFLHQHYAERIRLESLAGLAGLSVYHLIRVFRAATGLSPYAYLGQVRVHRAAELLRDGMAVSMVAATTGFADQSHLTRLFKRLVGVPPGEYQRAWIARRAPLSRRLRGRLVQFSPRLEPGSLYGRCDEERVE
jgi:AraC-like DNA-binding protein